MNKHALVFIAIALSGCASAVVTEDKLYQRTAFTLGLEQSDFKIYDRSDEGVQTDYKVKTKSGKTYSCYVAGSVSVLGRSVSDAICSQSGGKKSAIAAPARNCNELLKAAGKC